MSYCKLISACAVLAATVGFAAPAMALPTTETFILTVDGCTGGCGGNGQGSTNNNFGSILLSDDGAGTVTITETLNGTEFVNSSGKEALAFNLASSVTGVTIGGFIPSTGYSQGSILTLPPFGAFGYAVHCDACGNGGSNPQPGPLTFTVTASSAGGVDLADFIANGSGDFFASDVIGLGTGNTGDVAATGVCRENCGRQVPEPLTLSLFGAGLAGAAALRRRRKKA